MAIFNNWCIKLYMNRRSKIVALLSLLGIVSVGVGLLAMTKPRPPVPQVGASQSNSLPDKPVESATIINTRYGFSFNSFGFPVTANTGFGGSRDETLSNTWAYQIGAYPLPSLYVDVLDPKVAATWKSETEVQLLRQPMFDQATSLWRNLKSTSTIDSVAVGNKVGLQFYGPDGTLYVFATLKNGLVISIRYPKLDPTLDRILDSFSFTD